MLFRALIVSLGYLWLNQSIKCFPPSFSFQRVHNRFGGMRDLAILWRGDTRDAS